MRPRLLSALLFLLVAVAIGGIAASSAVAAPRGGDQAARPGAKPAGDPIEELRPEELAYLRKKGWDQWDEHRRQRIALGVIRLRGLDHEQREKLMRRIEQMREGRKGSPDRDRRRMLMRHVGYAVGQYAYGALPDAMKTAARAQRLHPGAVGHALFRRLWSKAAVAETAGFTAERLESMPARHRKEIEKLFDAYRAADDGVNNSARKKAARRLGEALVRVRSEAVLREVERAHPRDRRAVASALGKAFHEAWPGAFEAVLRDMQKKPEKFFTDVRASAERMHMGKHGPMGAQGGFGRGSLQPRERGLLLSLLERTARFDLKARPELQTHVDALIQYLLVEGFKMDPAVVARGLDRSDPAARQAFLQRVINKHKMQLGGMRPGAGRRVGPPPGNGGQPGRDGRRGPPGGRRSGGDDRPR